MCGISGLIVKQSLQNIEQSITDMSMTLSHRGPDDHGCWIDDNKKIALAHRRLSILDLSHVGHQPMMSSSDRYIMVFNGEIYNFQSLAGELKNKSHQFNGHSDTEVMLSAIEEWGIESAVKKFNGMFAFAVYDRKLSKLYLVRYRLGIKPLYYGLSNGAFLFASELKAFRKFPGFNNEISRENLSSYLQYGYVPTPKSIYQNIFKLSAGTILEIDVNHYTALPNPVQYWSADEIAQEPIIEASYHQQKAQLDALLRDAVKLRMISDVPLGAFLSGGVDSSLVVALMQQLSDSPVKTFSIGFSEGKYNEAIYANKVANHLKTEHTELYVTPEMAMSVIPQLPALYDEPFADSSQIPTFLVSKLAREHVTVSLSGDGGDELFGGYNRYFWGDKIWRTIRLFPLPIRMLVKKVLLSISPACWDQMLNRMMMFIPNEKRFALPGDKIHKFASFLSSKESGEVYKKLVMTSADSDSLVLGVSGNGVKFSKIGDQGDFIKNMMLSDLKYYLPDDILTKVDRASMGVSLEARVPLLDHRAVEFAWSLPMDSKIQGARGKRILRDVLYQYVPKNLIERPKMGFAVPVDEWLRGPLKDWAENLLAEDRLKREGYFDVEKVRKNWREHLLGRQNRQSIIWAILMFEQWLESTYAST